MATIRWDDSGQVSTDGRYAINAIRSASGGVTYYLGTSPLFEVDQVDGEDVVVRDEVPAPCVTLTQAQRQAQAIEDGTLAAFEHERSGAVRVRRAARAQREAADAAKRAQAWRFALTAEPDERMPTTGDGESQTAYWLMRWREHLEESG